MWHISLENTVINDLVIPELLPLYVSGTPNIFATDAVCGSAEALLRRAAKAVAGSGSHHGPGDPKDPAEQEICSLASFAHENGLILDRVGIQRLIGLNPLPPGLEHTVGVLRASKRVLKDYDTWLIDEDTGEMAFKPTDSLFDYLTDHLLANHIFGDDIRLEGFYMAEADLHIVVSQPFVEGYRIESSSEFVEKLERQGLRQRTPSATPSNFYIDGGAADRLLITDLTEDNALYADATGLLHPIDIHFKFPSRKARLIALNALGLYAENECL